MSPGCLWPHSELFKPPGPEAGMGSPPCLGSAHHPAHSPLVLMLYRWHISDSFPGLWGSGAANSWAPTGGLEKGNSQEDIDGMPSPRVSAFPGVSHIWYLLEAPWLCKVPRKRREGSPWTSGNILTHLPQHQLETFHNCVIAYFFCVPLRIKSIQYLI